LGEIWPDLAELFAFAITVLSLPATLMKGR